MSKHGQLMDRIYSWQTGIYDLTRKPYLLGRDQLLDELCERGALRVLEIGCGTGRNLILLAKRMPASRFSGVDVSGVMLARARASIDKSGLQRDFELIQADAGEVRPELFGDVRFDEVFFSYALSMIPDWVDALSRAMDMVGENGTLSIVDFGDQAGWPDPLRAALRYWLRLFHVSPRDDMSAHVMVLAAAQNFELVESRRLHLGYSQLLTLRRRKAFPAVI